MTAPKPKRPPGLAQGRWLGDFPKLSAAEKALVAACARGETWEPVGWDGQRPEVATGANTIRAGLIRFLVLGGDADHPVHEVGVVLRGAWMIDALDLQNASSTSRIGLLFCVFVAPIMLRDAQLSGFFMNGSLVPGIDAERLTMSGSFVLRDGFLSTGEVRLRGVRIGGDLDCTGSQFRNCDENSIPSGNTINADQISVAGDVFLRDGFSSFGTLRLLGAKISGNLECQCGIFNNGDKEANTLGVAISADRMTTGGSVLMNEEFLAVGEVRMHGVKIGSSFECSKGMFLCGNKSEATFGRALSAVSMGVAGAFHARDANFMGIVDMSGAAVTELVDDDECWPANGLILDGFHYERIAGGQTGAKSRINWIKKQILDDVTTDFKPQPWEQLIKVLREMGHLHDAAEVAIAKQELMRVAGVVKGRLRRPLHWFYGKLIGYGHRPLRAIGWMAVVWLLCSLAFDAGREFGYFGPSNPLIHANPALAKCGGPGETLPDGTAKPFWHTPACPTPPEYTTMQPQLYSLDLILPLVDLQQETDWAPIVINENGTQLFLGYVLRILMWFEILFGWAMSLMLVAVLGRLVDKD